MLLLAGCASTVTNISAQRQLRNANGLYPVEVSLDSRQQTLRWESVQPTVIVGKEAYPMRLTHLMTNRWEAVIPVAASVNSVTYHYKLDYKVTQFGRIGSGSAASKNYTLQILDR